MKKTLGAVFAGAVLTLATAPAAVAQESTTTAPTETPTETSSSAPATTSSDPTTTTPNAQTAPIETSRIDQLRATQGVDPAGTDVPPTTTTSTPEKPYQDNIGHGFVGLSGEGILVIQCAGGPPGEVATANLSVTGGPDQDEADGRLWNYSVRVVTPPTGSTTPFSWTCNRQEGQGLVEFEQEQPPATTSTAAPTSSTAPITTANPGGGSSQGRQVKVAPKGGVETGFGGMTG